MTVDEKIERITGLVGTVAESVDRLTAVVGTLAATVAAHDDHLEAYDRQLGKLIEFADKQGESIAALDRRMAALDKRWEAYLNTIRPQ